MTSVKSTERRKILVAICGWIFIIMANWIVLEVSFYFCGLAISPGIFQFNKEFGFQVAPHVNGSNEFGFNDIDRPHKKPNDVYRIAIVGDSYNWSGGRDCTYSALLQKLITQNLKTKKKIEVLNIGYPMTGTSEEWKILKTYGLQYEPDMVILAFFTGNDFTDSYPYRKRFVISGIMFDIDTRENQTVFGLPIIRQSMLSEFLKQLWTVHEKVEATDKEKSYCGYPTAPLFTDSAFAEINKHKLYFLSHESAQSGEFDLHISTVDHTIGEMKDALNQRGTQFRILILPDELSVDQAVANEEMRLNDVTPEQVDLFRAQTLIKDIAKKYDVSFFDLTDVFREQSKTKHLYLPRNTHWSQDGNDLAAQQLFHWIEPALAAIP